MAQFNNEYYRYGSARFASRAERRRAGLHKPGKDKLLLGFDGHDPLYFGGQGGVVTIAGARSGKLTCSTAYTALCASWGHNALYLDVKSEAAAISQWAVTRAGRYGIYFCPVPLPGAPARHRINPLDFCTIDSPSLVDDIQMMANNMIAKSGTKNGNFFDGQAKRKLEGLAIAITRRDGVLTLPALYEAINLMVVGGENWLNRVGYYMDQCRDTPYFHVVEIEEEIARAHNDPTNETYHSMVGVLTNSFTCLASPALREAVSPHADGTYDFSFADLTRGENLYSVFICIPQEYLQVWGPVVRAMFVSARIHKGRAPDAAPQLWCLDECGNTGGAFPLAVEAFTIGAGLNIKPWAIFQSQRQIGTLMDGAENILLSSAQTQQYFGVRDYQTADSLSKRLGAQSLFYDDEHAQARAAHARQQAMYQMASGADPIEAAMRMRHENEAAQRQHVQQRMLRTPAEILNTPAEQQYIFTDGLPPILCEKRPYYAQAFMAGRYLPNPYHPPTDRVRIKTRLTHKWRRVIHEPVPERYAHLPQYQDGFWTRLQD